MSGRQDDTKVENYLGMSDDEILKLDPTLFELDAGENTPEADTGEAYDADEATDPDHEPATAAADADDAGEDGTDPDEDEADDADDDDSAAQPGAQDRARTRDNAADQRAADGDDAADADANDGADDDAKPTNTADADADTDAQIDYKAAYERLTAPFKANGKDLQVKSVDEAITLMQMGANYNKKMAALKPNLKLLKMLENHQLLDEQKLSFLVDLEKKNPEAIKKLLKDSAIDPMELNLEEESTYKPNTYTARDQEVELDLVLERLQDTPTYSKLIDVVSTKWDEPSKRIVADNPQLLGVINDHMASGVYDVISKEIESERMFGRLSGLSDLEAYKQVGDAIQARGGFNHLAQKAPVTPPATPAPAAQTHSLKSQQDEQRKNRKRAASPAPAGAAPKSDNEFNPLAMSDEEFEKLVQKNLM